LKIEFDPKKLRINLIKHGITFDEAATALLDSMALAQEDIYSEGEIRWILIGLSSQAKLLIVVYTLRNDDVIRLISARKATRKEIETYYA